MNLTESGDVAIALEEARALEAAGLPAAARCIRACVKQAQLVPDLVDALHALLAAYPRLDGELPIWNQARAALAKAEDQS